MKVILVIGRCVQGKCGVGDYTRRLAGAMQKGGINVDVLCEGGWGFWDAPTEIKTIGMLGADVIHFQYPTSGFGYRLGPQLFTMARRCVTTFHEASQSHVLRKLALYPFAVRAEHLIFTSDYEHEFGMRWAPWVRERSSVIPIGSNVEAHKSNGTVRNDREVAYFGLLMPGKGLEDVVVLAGMIKERGLHLIVRLIGEYRPEHQSYFRELRSKTEGLPVIWDTGLTDIQVSERLASTCVAYLPYPDGASDRRTTLKAALSNGVAVITTRGRSTPRELESLVKFAASPAEALATAQMLLSNHSERNTLAEGTMKYLKRFSWDIIANSHCKVYEKVLRNRANSY